MANSPREGTAARSLIAGATVIAVAWIAAHALRYNLGSPYVGALILGTLGLTLGFGVASILSLGRPSEPARFLVREGQGFVVPLGRARAYFQAGQLLLTGVCVARLIDVRYQSARTPAPSQILAKVDLALEVSFAVLVGLIVAMSCLLVIAALRGNDRLMLSPTGLGFRHEVGRVWIPWESIRPGTPLRPEGSRGLALVIDQPRLCTRRGLFIGSPSNLEIAPRSLSVHPWFLADAIRFYVDHPDRRAGIGTTTEYARLCAEFGIDGLGASAAAADQPLPTDVRTTTD